MRVVFYTGGVDEIREAVVRDKTHDLTETGDTEIVDITTELKKDVTALHKRAGEATFFASNQTFLLNAGNGTLSDSLWDSIVEHNNHSSHDTHTTTLLWDDNTFDPTENVLIVSVRTIPAATKKKLSNPHIQHCAGKTPVDTGRLYLTTVNNLPRRITEQFMNIVGRETHLLPLLVSELRQHHGHYLETVSNLTDITTILHSVETQKTPWQLTDAIDKGDIHTALNTARALTATKTGHVGVTVILRNHLAQLHRLQGLKPVSDVEAGGLLKHKGSTYPLKKAMQTVPRYGLSIPGLLQLCDEAYTQLTGGSTLDKDIIVDILVARLSATVRQQQTNRR